MRSLACTCASATFDQTGEVEIPPDPFRTMLPKPSCNRVLRSALVALEDLAISWPFHEKCLSKLILGGVHDEMRHHAQAVLHVAFGFSEASRAGHWLEHTAQRLFSRGG